ncbi:phosphotransferase [Microvirga sp. VF16]|uniref:phosphotransferase n=1 Tax=Microvirga sp. VF16 TaxID=2807101 RepID=UPI00193E50C5|nr:phosphotransferase [Microvirga sp. VF16]QRM35754.1 phosphotransferase [Microvirga sp. VF16]
MSTTSQASINAVLETAVPVAAGEEVKAIALQHFGIRGEPTRLPGERDSNFHIRTEEGDHFLLRISNPVEDRQVTDFQTKLLLHIEQTDPLLPVPRIVRSVEGRSEIVLTLPGQLPSVVRLYTFLQGEPLHKTPPSRRQRRNMGGVLARIDLAMREFQHPASNHELMWDMKHAHRLCPLLVHVEDPQRRALVERFLDRFEQFVLPAMPNLRTQVIHNDLNPHNVLVAERDHDHVTGVIDFGDAVLAPLVNDPAVAAAYRNADAGHPLETVSEFIAGYHAVLPLDDAEFEILFDLVVTRMILTVLITSWRAAIQPENREYILRNAPSAWAGLERFAALDRAEAHAYLRRNSRPE